MKGFVKFFLLSVAFTTNAKSESFLTAQSFPKTFDDLSFQKRIDVLEEGYEPFADLSAYDILNIVYTDENIDAEITADEENSVENGNAAPDDASQTNTDTTPSTTPNQTPAPISTPTPNNSAGYCQQKAPHIPQNQTIPIGKPVLVSDYKYCSGYGVRKFGTKKDNHYGFEIGCTDAHYDRPVFSAADGVVERVQPNRRGSSAGNYIVINHQNGFKTYYMHLNTMLVSKGQTVNAGCQIGTIGYTGGAKAFKSQYKNDDYPVMRKSISHLHYEMHYSGPLQSVTDSTGKKIPIVHKFGNHKSVDPAYFMGVK